MGSTVDEGRWDGREGKDGQDGQVVLCTSRADSSPSSPLESLGGSRVLAALGGRRLYAGTVVVPRAQLHTEQEKIFTGVVDTWQVGINQQYLYSSGEYLILLGCFKGKR